MSNKKYFNLRKDNIKQYENNKSSINHRNKRQSQQVQFNHNKSFLSLLQVKQYDLRYYLSQLYKSTSYQKQKIFGFNIRSLQHDLEHHIKIKINLLAGIYKIFNWQNASTQTIQQFLLNYPQSQNQVQEIHVENGYVKLNKLNQTLKINIKTNQIKLQSKIYQLNRLQGKNYNKSFTKIWNQLFSYNFNGKIRQISSNLHLIAVRTDNQISIITPDQKQNSFKINQIKQVAVCGYRCYYIRQNGSIGSILMQNTYMPRYGQLINEEKMYGDNLKQTQFLAVGDNRILVVQINLDQQAICVRKLQGKVKKFSLESFQLMNKDQALVCRKAFIEKGFLYVLLFIGIDKNVTHMIEYRFLIF